jgi:hypothetical protein
MSKVKMDMRWNVDLNHPDGWIDSWIDTYSVDTLGFVSERFFYLLAMVQDLPDEDVNKPEMQRYVDRARIAAHEKNLDALEGWINALAVSVKAVRLFIPKTHGKVRQEEKLNEVRAAGAQANKAKADTNKANLHKAINDYLNHPAALTKGNKACLRFLVERKLTYGYAEATILDPHIKKLFAAKRKAMKAEN